jgi:hydroxymethylglutaryl-CoA synthase
MRGIIDVCGHLPHWRLERSEIAAVLGSGGGAGTRTVASYDEDPVTLGVAAARTLLVGRPDAAPVESLTFATTAPVYAEKSSSPLVHAALQLPASVSTLDAGPGLRGASASLRAALHSTDRLVAVIAGDVRTGLAGSADETGGGDAGSAVLIGDDSAGPLVAEHLGGASATHEFLDRWRSPGELRMHAWEERFGQQRYDALAADAWDRAVSACGLTDGDVARVAVSSPHPRAGATLVKRLGAAGVDVADRLDRSVGFTGAAHPGLLLADLVERSAAGEVIALVSLADGAEVFLFRRTAAGSAGQPIAGQLAAGSALPYGKYLAWRGVLPTQPPNRPEPARMSASAAERRSEWKYGFVGSRDRSSGAVHLPPARVSYRGQTVDDMEALPMAAHRATVATFTVDSLAYSPSPPVVFAVCDFEDGGRLPMELTDVSASEVRIGMLVEMTFRRIGTADGIANYFWKARPVPGAAGAGEAD